MTPIEQLITEHERILLLLDVVDRLGDLALRRAVSRFYFGDVQLDDKQVEEFSRRWSPFRTYATVYMFTAMRTGMG